MLLVAIALAQARNPLGLIFGIVGLWKFGFPETLLSIVEGYHHDDGRQTRLIRLTAFMNGFGSLFHHSAAMLYLCVFCRGLSPLTRLMVNCAMPLVLQHLVISLKYISMPLYAISELLLETFWELGIFCSIEMFYL